MAFTKLGSNLLGFLKVIGPKVLYVFQASSIIHFFSHAATIVFDIVVVSRKIMLYVIILQTENESITFKDMVDANK